LGGIEGDGRSAGVMGGARELWGGTFGDSRGAVVMVLFRTNVHPL